MGPRKKTPIPAALLPLLFGALHSFSVLLLFFFFLLFFQGCGGTDGYGQANLTNDDLAAEVVLSQGWLVQSARVAGRSGEVISTPGIDPSGWYPATVPSTILAVLTGAGVYPDPYFGMNLRSIPGTRYPIGKNFSNWPMPLTSPFRSSWWYRTEFAVPEAWRGRSVVLQFNGINFRANAWLNGSCIAESTRLAGTYRTHTIDVTPSVVFGETNVLGLEVLAPGVFDLAHTWVDWNPMPPDKNMGLWREVMVRASGRLRLADPQVLTHLDMPSLDTASIAVWAEVANTGPEPVEGSVTVRVEGEDVVASQGIALQGNEVRAVVFSSEEFPQLALSRPRLWWPRNLGEQHLYEVEITTQYGEVVSDRTKVRFGIRDVASEIDERGNRVFKINGERVLVRGAGWAPDMMFRSAPEREEAEIEYVKNLGLNAIRLEGKLGSDHLLELCDENGILVLAGWCCCDHWEHWPLWDSEDYEIAAGSLHSQAIRLRNHPSVVAWFNGSDFHPPPDVEQMYLDILAAARWPNLVISSATEAASPVSGPTGMKMTGPYEYVPPVYWYSDTRYGGAFGFNTETSPGPSIPPLESLKAMLPEEELWPVGDAWNYHAGGGQFKDIKIFTKALERRYGPPAGLEDFLEKAQAMNYEAHRAMFEAYGRNKYSATGVIQWMLNDAWPSVIWHLYDFYLRPAGSYFGAKKACEPLHVQYSYDDRSIVVVNEYHRDMGVMSVSARLFDMDLVERYSARQSLSVPSDSSIRAFVLPEIQGLSRAYFLDLALFDARGTEVSSNFYWLSTQPDVMAWGLTDWYYTPILVYGDLTGLQNLPRAELEVRSSMENEGGEETVRIAIENTSPSLAFLVRVEIRKWPGGEEVLPVLWDDNYVSILPGRTKEIAARYKTALLDGFEPVLAVRGWNVMPLVKAVGQ